MDGGKLLIPPPDKELPAVNNLDSCLDRREYWETLKSNQILEVVKEYLSISLFFTLYDTNRDAGRHGLKD